MNEVLRRKLFRTVLADSRSPTGILASSPEMVEAVQRRQSGGLQRGGGSIASNVSPRRVIAGQQFNRLTGGLPERQPESYLQVLERIKNLPFNQQAQELTKAGFGATIGPNIPNFLSQTADTAKQVIGADIEDTKQMLGNLLGPDADKSIREALTKGVRSLKYATGLAGVGEEGGLGNEPTAGVGKTRAQLLEEEDSAAQNIAGSPVMGANRPAVDDDLEAGMAGDVPVTEAETLQQSRVSGAETKTTLPKPDSSKSSLQKANEIIEARKANQAASQSSLAQTSNQEEAANAVQTVQNIQTGTGAKLTDKKKAELTDETVGIVPKGENPTPKERIEARKALITEMLGEERAKDIRTDANYNLIMTGLMIAAGESPSALVNIAKGAAAGLQKYGEVTGEKAERRNKEEKAITLQAISEIRGEISEERKRTYDDVVRQSEQDFQIKLQDQKDRAALTRLGAQITSSQKIELDRLNLKMRLANQSFEDSVALLNIKGEQAEAIQDIRQSFLRELEEFKQDAPTDDMKMIQAMILNSGGTLSFEDAFAKLKARSTARTSDQQMRYNQLKEMGFNDAQAFMFSGSGVTKAIIDQIGLSAAEKKLAAPQQQQGSGGSKAKVKVGDIVNQEGKSFRVTALNKDGGISDAEEIK